MYKEITLYFYTMKKIFFIACMLLIIPFVSAELMFKQGQDIGLKVPCSNNDQQCTINATCNITIFAPNGNVLVDNQDMTNSGVFFNFTLSQQSTINLGEHQASLFCEDNDLKEFTTFPFIITPNGSQPSMAQGLIYAMGLAITTVFLILSTYAAWHIDGRDKLDMAGRVIQINKGKFGKLFFWGLSYMLLIVVSYFLWVTSLNFLFTSELSSFMEMLFTFLWRGLLPVGILVTGIFFYQIIMDMRLEKLLTRNLPVRNTKRRR